MAEDPLSVGDVGGLADGWVTRDMILTADENGDEDLAAALREVEGLVKAGLETEELLRGDGGVGEEDDACCGRRFGLDKEALPFDTIEDGPADAVDGDGVGFVNEGGIVRRDDVGHFNGDDPLVDDAEESAIAFSPSVTVQRGRGRIRDGVVDLLHREPVDASDHLDAEVGNGLEFGGAGEVGRGTRLRRQRVE